MLWTSLRESQQKGRKKRLVCESEGRPRGSMHFASGDTRRPCWPRDQSESSESSAWSPKATQWCDFELRTPRRLVSPLHSAPGLRDSSTVGKSCSSQFSFRCRHWLRSGVSRGTPVCRDVGETGIQAPGHRRTRPRGTGRDQVHVLALSPHAEHLFVFRSSHETTVALACKI